MSTNYITIITGAGASKAYGFPLGDELLNKVVEYLKSQMDKGFILKNHSEYATPEEINEIIDYIENNRNKKDCSIDRMIELAFIERGKKYQQERAQNVTFKNICHFAIANILLNCERDINPLRETNWHTLLFDKIEAIGIEKFKIITFNYDRSLEWYFYNRLLEKYGHEDVATLMKDLGFIKLYGGPYNAWNREVQVPDAYLPYGQNHNNPKPIQLAASQFLTIGEIATDNSTAIHHPSAIEKFEEALEIMSNSEKILILGLNLFSKENTERLKLKDFGSKTTASLYNGSDEEVEELKKRFDIKIINSSNPIVDTLNAEL